MSGEAVLLLSLVYIAQGVSFYHLNNKFGGDPREFGSFLKLFVEHVYTMFYHCIFGDSLNIHVPKINEYRHCIWHRLISEPVI